MSFSQFGYPYSTTSQFFVSASPSTTCCETVSRSVSDASSGSAQAATICCPSYENRLLASTRPELNAALGMYNSPYTAAAAGQTYANYLPYSTEPAALYTTLNSQYEIKDGTSSLHSGIAQPAAFYPYDHSLGQYQYDRYGTVDFTGSARRKNATRETTSTLKTWLYEHRKNPYPTKGEKIMLAIITKMTLTQVSTWFANARRRLKKENKMTWSPKNKGAEERKDEAKREEEEYGPESEGKDAGRVKDDKELRLEPAQVGSGRKSSLGESEPSDCSLSPPGHFHSCPKSAPPAGGGCLESGGAPSPAQPCDKPRIWSLAHTAGASVRAEQRPASPACARLPAPGHRPDLRPPPEPAEPSKIFRRATFNLPLGCASCPVRAEPCQCPPGAPGFGRSGRAGQGALELSEGCGGQQKDKLRTAFRPVLKR